MCSMLIEVAYARRIVGHGSKETTLGLFISLLLVVTIFIELLIDHVDVKIILVQFIELLLDKGALSSLLT